MYLYGASGHAKVIIDILESSGTRVSGLFDDNPAIKELYGRKVMGMYTGQALGAPLIISIGDNAIRAKIARSLHVDFGRVTHSMAIVSPSATIAAGTVTMQGAVVQADAVIGKHVILNTRASIDHDCVVGDYVHISPGPGEGRPYLNSVLLLSWNSRGNSPNLSQSHPIGGLVEQ